MGEVPSVSLGVDPAWAAAPSPAGSLDPLQPLEAGLGDETWAGPGSGGLGQEAGSWETSVSMRRAVHRGS